MKAPPVIGRRRLLLGLAGLGVAAGTTGLVLQTTDVTGAFRATLERLIGPFTIDDTEFARFVSDFQARSFELNAYEASAVSLAGALGLTQTAVWLGLPGSERLRAFERVLLTEFSLATGIARGTARGDRLRYAGLFWGRGCGNPFANLD